MMTQKNKIPLVVNLRVENLRILALLCPILLLAACGTKMPLDAGTSRAPNHSLGVFLVTTDNLHTDIALLPTALTVKSEDGKIKEAYAFSDPLRKLGDKSYQMVGSIELPPGRYIMKEFAGITDLDFLAILPVRGQFYQDISREFTLAPGKISYLGHLKATLVKRTSDDQERAGPIIPLLEQAKTGMSDGTLQFVFEDNFPEDKKLLEEKYPALKETEVIKAVIVTQ